MINVFFDLDGVLMDYESKFNLPIFNHKEFKEKVMDEKLFEKLDLMPNAQKFFNHIEYFMDHIDINIEILSSLGAPRDVELQREVARQKQFCLNKHGFAGYHANFTIHKGIKCKFATPNSILIDDHPENIKDFIEHSGQGLLYVDSNYNENIESVTEMIETIIKRKAVGIYS